MAFIELHLPREQLADMFFAGVREPGCPHVVVSSHTTAVADGIAFHCEVPDTWVPKGATTMDATPAYCYEGDSYATRLRSLLFRGADGGTIAQEFTP